MKKAPDRAKFEEAQEKEVHGIFNKEFVRICCDGSMQKEGIDYTKTYAPPEGWHLEDDDGNELHYHVSKHTQNIYGT
eukprot:scaffold47440_cov51-Attheya_sp.AAC.2